MRDVRILDFSRVLAGPWATQQLADQGAVVIKVEPPGGDETRRFGPLRQGVSTYFAALNRNKRSLVLDLGTEAGREVARKLGAWADVVVQNYRPGVAERLGIGFEQLRAVRPDLIYVAIHAFGEQAEGWRDRAGYDLVLQSMGGTVSMTGHPGSPPVRAGTPVADLNAAQLCVQAVLMGLLHRERTGEGQKIVVNMMQAQVAALTYLASRWTLAGEREEPRGSAHRGLAPYNLYRCRDGWLAVACGNDAIWQRMRAALGLADEARWRTNGGRVAHREALDAAIEARLGAWGVAEADERLTAARVPCGPVLDVAQAVAHEAVQLVEVDDPALGPVALPGLSLRTATSRTTHRPPPALDADRGAILEELGLSGSEAARLEAGGAFGRVGSAPVQREPPSGGQTG